MPKRRSNSPTPFFTKLRRWASSIAYVPVIDLMASQGDTPWQILVATMLSSRTKDETTAAAARRLFAVADTPEKTREVPSRQLERLIFPVGFYKVKARTLRDLARTVIERHGGDVPRKLDDLTALPGIGIKTATLVQIKAFGRDEICVDTHVHRLVNLWRIVETKTPEETRTALKKSVPKRYWRTINQDLVTLGQTICKPQKHYCERCPVHDICPAAFRPVQRKLARTSSRING